MHIKCAICGAAFECNPDSACWCRNLPNVIPVPAADSCLCPKCLAQKIDAAMEAYAGRRNSPP